MCTKVPDDDVTKLVIRLIKYVIYYVFYIMKVVFDIKTVYVTCK